MTTHDLYVKNQIEAYEKDPAFIANGWALSIAEEVVTLLGEKGKNQSWLASEMEVSRSRVSYILSAPTNMTLLTLAKLSVALDVPARIILNPSRTESDEPMATGYEYEDALIKGLAGTAGDNHVRIFGGYAEKQGIADATS